MLIKLSTKKGPKGSYGTYFKLSNTRGVKVLHGAFTNFMAALNSWEMDEARKERDLLNKAFRSGITPKCYGVTVVQSGRQFRVGIVMQHVGDQRLSEVSTGNSYGIIQGLSEKLRAVGIRHTDLHDYNVMKKGKKFYAIDFTPGCIMEEKAAA